MLDDSTFFFVANIPLAFGGLLEGFVVVFHDVSLGLGLGRDADCPLFAWPSTKCRAL